MDKTHPLVSIIIATYNNAPYLKESIDSALNQSWKNVEIIIINDGSTDETLYILENYLHNKNIKIFTTKNNGQCKATNIGIEKSSGEYIQFLDGDDILDPKKIEEQMILLTKRSDKCVAVSKWSRFHHDLTHAVIDTSFERESYSKLDWFNLLWTKTMMPNSGYLIPIDICKKSGNYLENLSTNNDFEYFTKIILSADSIVYCEKSMVYYRIVPKSLSQKADIKSQTSVLNARLLGSDYIIKYFNDKKSADNLVFHALFYFIYTYRNNLKLMLIASKKISKKTNYKVLPKHNLNKFLTFSINTFGINFTTIILHISSYLKRS